MTQEDPKHDGHRARFAKQRQAAQNTIDTKTLDQLRAPSSETTFWKLSDTAGYYQLTFKNPLSPHQITSLTRVLRTLGALGDAEDIPLGAAPALASGNTDIILHKSGHTPEIKNLLIKTSLFETKLVPAFAVPVHHIAPTSSWKAGERTASKQFSTLLFGKGANGKTGVTPYGAIVVKSLEKLGLSEDDIVRPHVNFNTDNTTLSTLTLTSDGFEKLRTSLLTTPPMSPPR